MRAEDLVSIHVEASLDGVTVVLETTRQILRIPLSEPKRQKLIFDLGYPKVVRKTQ